MMLRLVLIFLLLLPMTACAEEDPLAPVNSPTMSRSHKAIATPPIQMEPNCKRPLELIGHPASEVTPALIPNTYRILGPHTPATMDFSPSRTNVLTDDKGIIREIRCG